MGVSGVWSVLFITVHLFAVSNSTAANYVLSICVVLFWFVLLVWGLWGYSVPLTGLFGFGLCYFFLGRFLALCFLSARGSGTDAFGHCLFITKAEEAGSDCVSKD